MICSTLKRSVLLAAAICSIAVLSQAQGPLYKQVNYSTNVSHRIGDYLVPPGDYVLYQVSHNDLNMFRLYQKDMAREPIATIRTTRIDYSRHYPDHTKILFEFDESGGEARPVLRGWTIPGEDGWRIISVIAKNDRILTRIK